MMGAPDAYAASESTIVACLFKAVSERLADVELRNFETCLGPNQLKGS